MRSRKSQIEDEKSRRSGFGGLCGGDPAVGLSVVRLFRHVGGGEFRFRECLRVEHEARRRAVAFLRELKLFDGERPDGEDVAVHAVARGRRRPAVFRFAVVVAKRDRAERFEVLRRSALRGGSRRTSATTPSPSGRPDRSRSRQSCGCLRADPARRVRANGCRRRNSGPRACGFLLQSIGSSVSFRFPFGKR